MRAGAVETRRGTPLVASAAGEARLLLRRVLFLALVLCTVGAVSTLLWDMLRANGVMPLEVAIFALATLLLVPIALSFWMALAGFAVELSGGDPLALDLAEADGVRGPLRARTAIVVPVCNEDPADVTARLRAMHESLERIGHERSFDVFVLSDTMNPQRWLDEELSLQRCTAELGGAARVHYRHRARNIEHKAGNIGEFCSRWGDRYATMIVLDADSVMTGSALVRLVRLMELHPEAGIIQAPPVPVNRRTLFGRLQQFAAAVYGPTWSAGLAWIQGGEGNYYGHNAIVRIAPFLESCRLPRLPGRAPLGGSILSHDFVEAALMRRAGHRVYLAADLGGSYEEPPPTLIDFAARDRRWCQGNLQHARLLGMQGLHVMSRLHLLQGVMAYVSAPVWILLLVLSTLEALRLQFSGHEYFAPGGSLFPVWQVSIEARSRVLFGLVMLLLFLPRLLALLARLRDPDRRRSFGGGWRLALSSLGETLFSMLLAPVLALMQARFVIGALCGLSTGWNAQTRTDRGTPLAVALRRHAGTTVLGLLWIALVKSLAPELFWWMLPVLSGMVLAVPLSVLSSRVSAGRWARRHRLFLTPEEVSPPPVLRALHEHLAAGTRRVRGREERSALVRVLSDPAARAAHLAWSSDAEPRDPLAEHAVQGLVLKCRLHGPASLDDDEQAELLRAPDALLELVREGVTGASGPPGGAARR
jgi:membrane glycosyltransferase